MDKSIFAYTDYKELLKARIQPDGQTRVGYKGALAKAMRTPSAFLSQVLHSKTHLSLDHGLRLCLYWGFSPDERDYFLALIQHARAGSAELRSLLKEQLAEIRGRNEDLSHRFRQPSIQTSEQQWAYYTAWHLGAIHMLVTIEAYRTPPALARRLQLPAEIVLQALRALQEMDLVKMENGIWTPLKKSIHLNKNSPASLVNHLIWRQRAVQRGYELNARNFSYTGLHSLSRADIELVRSLLLEMIEKVRSIVERSPEEEVICLNLDLFEV